MDTETWLDIQDYEGLYQASNLGRIKSLYKQIGFHYYKETILKPGRDKRGYPQVVLSKKGVRKGCRVHRLIAETFLPNPNNKRTVNHLDQNKTNNYVSNLEWATNQENIEYSQNKPILQIKGSTVVGIWASASEAARNGFHQGHISQCCNKIPGFYSHRGYKWSFK